MESEPLIGIGVYLLIWAFAWEWRGVRALMGMAAALCVSVGIGSHW